MHSLHPSSDPAHDCTHIRTSHILLFHRWFLHLSEQNFFSLRPRFCTTSTPQPKQKCFPWPIRTATFFALIPFSPFRRQNDLTVFSDSQASLQSLYIRIHQCVTFVSPLSVLPSWSHPAPFIEEESPLPSTGYSFHLILDSFLPNERIFAHKKRRLRGHSSSKP